MKPTITKEQAHAIELMHNFGHKDDWILCAHAVFLSGHAPRWYDGQVFDDTDLLTLAAALVNGYEVEATPEERVREYYEAVRNLREERYLAGDTEGKRFHAGALVGICTTLNIFGIKIEGVNV